ncbi:multifunctional transcriptional regulator/nicotinamide-nucleotide adenylyltransferase/ribosylnicotinamide kinase NadR [Mesobacillus subterraneus]|uniref:multifunctional transcriptional regulator/nicotinamide-nucleotide adenylyltransferase/ribosylnicotinamide kinase NadR n=1 Tax=Mesobacillus subterraneus TaxID=285983 RepID=UPI00203E279F|nr:multifunctional transcriptional regulator/nicotinamide-nucleotide adenylyltransferase/ribosylnicotinamide kinase NadR [Mesobacillus subterraneus]MCM3666729.1 multifunctional transcriptional regulator/nicotinamide-nucleotide adenylyltransferase/ribosylnicotinamide kinase NadR [Mesobacillus subterraneus]MCM3685626.1 multifunctional transcriptional regulator/nicotinamide-nucleotide adenylyltransferase/ribosylnicotinamide kinase NadR [Mesobacillus subterraneus]
MTIGKVGMYGGKFVPVHLGHVYAMIKASTMVEELHVIVSYDTEHEKNEIFKNSKVPNIPYKMRVRWWSQLTKDLPHVHVHVIEEIQTGHFSDWEKGAEAIKKAISKEIDVVFSSENRYSDYFNVLYPNAKHVVIDADREKYPISATAIRTEGAIKHWEMLPKVVQPFFVKKVVIVGTESCGKSTLVQNLAALYNTTYVEEIGRIYYERLGDCETITLPTDFPEIAIEHKYREKQQLEKANKVLFVDTEATVTQYFSMLYVNEHQSVLDQLASIQDYDLWLFLEPDVEWVDDGTRSFGEQSVREANNAALKRLLLEQGIAYEIIKGDYEERLSRAIVLVDKLLT